MRVVFLPEAESEMIESALYYQRQVAGLDRMLVLKVEYGSKVGLILESHF
jgi:hypothetical protein